MSNRKGHIMINLKQLLYDTSRNKIFVSAWMEKQGIDRKTTYSYKRNGWLTSLGHGAFIKKDNLPMLDAGVEALQTQLGLPIHFGGKSTLADWHNVAHFLNFKNVKSELFAPNKTPIPAWFKSTFKDEYDLTLSDFLPKKIGIEGKHINDFRVEVSSPERAFLEMLYSVPEKTSTKEAYQILELLPTLRPKLLNELLSQCKSIKVNRLFLYLASEVKHDWFESIKAEKINLGSGVRTIDKLGVYHKKYELVVNNVGEV